MRCLILIRYIAAAATHSAAYVGDAACPGDGMHAVGPAAQPGVCSVCWAGVFDTNTNTGAGDLWSNAETYFNSGKCPHCGRSTVHLGCALSSLYQVNCHGCNGAVCCRFDELDRIIEQLRNGDAETVSTEALRSSLGDLEPMEHSLMILTFHSYDMTISELLSLKKFVGNANGVGACYPNVVYVINCIIWSKSIVHMKANEMAALLADAQALAVALPILGMAITPHFIAEAKEEEIVALIKLFAGHRGANAGISGALVKKVIDLTDIMRIVRFSNDGIKDLLCGLISSNSCAAAKHLIGRYRFGHWLANDDVCAIIEQYAAACIYDDEAFMSLLVFLVNENVDVVSCEHYMMQLSDKLSERNGGTATTQAHQKLQSVVQKCRSNTVSMRSAVDNYARAPGDGDFRLDEDVFCMVARIRNPQSEFVRLLGRARGTKVAHIVRHAPISWTRKNAKFCMDVAEQAIEQENLAMLEEAFAAFRSTRQSPQNMRHLFDILLKSGHSSYAGLALKIISYYKLRHLKRKSIADWLLAQLLERKEYWCLPYFKGLVDEKERYRRAISHHHQEIMGAAVFGEFQFSPMFHGIIRYDVENVFFMENLREYLGVLLKASSDRYVVQRLLIDLCTTRLFSRGVNENNVAVVYELLREHRDRIFYIDAFYHALRYTMQKNCLKVFMINDLEEGMFARNRWAVASMASGALCQIKKYKKCRSLGRAGSHCGYCEIISTVAFGDLIAMLRYAQANQ